MAKLWNDEMGSVIQESRKSRRLSEVITEGSGKKLIVLKSVG